MLPERHRILMIIPQIGYGGAEGAFMRLANYLAQHADVTIALMAWDYGDVGYTNIKTEIDLPIVLLDSEKSINIPLFRKILRWLRMLRQLSVLKRKFDISISFLSGANLLNALSGSRKKTIVSERGSKLFDTGQPDWKKRLWLSFLDPLIYYISEKIVCASVGLAGEIIERNPTVAKRVVAFEGTILSGRLLELADAPISEDLQAYSQYQIIFSYGRMSKQKGFDFLLQVFSNLRKTLPMARLILIGDGPELNSLLNLAESLSLKVGMSIDPENLDVMFLGYRENPIRYLRYGNLFVMPSRYEGLPNALIEALATGVPVLSADCPWGPRSVLSGAGDLFVDSTVTQPIRLMHGSLLPVPDSSNAIDVWSQEIRSMLINPLPRKSKEECRNAIDRFDINVTGEKWLELIK